MNTIHPLIQLSYRHLTKQKETKSHAFGQHLVMDLINGLVTLSNRLPGITSRELTPVYLKRENVQVWSPEVQYQSAAAIENASGDINQDSQKQKSNRLGALLARIRA